MSENHPLAPLMPDETAAKALADNVGCSVAHLRNIRDGRKSASVELAERLMQATGLPIGAFIKRQTEAAE